MQKIWEKNNSMATNTLVDSYCFQEGVEYDNQLVLYDVLGSIAHMHMLAKIGYISTNEEAELLVGLKNIITLYKKNQFIIIPSDEDVHTKIESFLTQKLGTAALKIHTGRSRNDQVAVDLRLYAKDKTIELALNAVQTIQCLIDYAKQYEYIPMPGYTHMQKAMPSSIGLWMGSFAESLIDDLHLLMSVYTLNDQSPLGSGAAYGVSLPIDREMTTCLLGFSSVLNNSLYCQAARPKIQLALLQVFVQIMISASKLASDLLLFTTSEFDFFHIEENISTGSSIMPQKKNLDVLEYIRAKTHTIISYEQMIAGISVGIPSGYNADFGQTKKPFMESIDIVSQTLEVIVEIIACTKPNSDTLKKACTKELFAAHAAYEMVQKGTPFRAAYQAVGSNLKSLSMYEAIDVIKQTNHTGGPGNVGLDKKQNKLNKIKNVWKKEQSKFSEVVNNLLETV